MNIEEKVKRNIKKWSRSSVYFVSPIEKFLENILGFNNFKLNIDKLVYK